MSDDESNVVTFKLKGGQPGQFVRQFTRAKRECNHRNAELEIDAERSVVTCSDCNLEMTPLNALLVFVGNEEQWQEKHDRVKAGMAELESYRRETFAMIENRSRCKCEHCGKMTTIPRR